MNTRDIIEKWLRDNGCDGLCCDDCGCGVDDLMPCEPNEGITLCVAARFVEYDSPECNSRVDDLEGDCFGCRGVDPCPGCYVEVSDDNS